MIARGKWIGHNNQRSNILATQSTMKFGVIAINVGISDPEQMITTAQAAEQAGFESAWTFEHVMMPMDNKSKYPYNESGDLGVPPEAPFYDPLISLTAIARETKTLRIGTGVNILSQTNPLLLAKQLASLDGFSQGRLIFGAGIGWLEQEFDAMGAPFARRGARFDDYIVAMKKVWSGEVVEQESDFLSWHGFKSYPLPAQKSGIPIVMGGKAGKIFERVAKHGDGWFLPPASPDEIKGLLAKLRGACTTEGRSFDDIELTTLWSPEAGEDSLKALSELGISRAVIMGGGVDAIRAVADAHIR
jgi:probable F420-dependent oxidoreductase